MKFTDASLKLSKTVFSFQDLVEQVLEEHSAGIESSGIALEYRSFLEGTEISADPNNLARVLSNLFDNLEKYCSAPGKAKLLLEQDKTAVVLKLLNTAELPENIEPEQLFDRMFRGDESRGEIAGSGLGLSISREIIRLHDGEIRADYDKGYFKITMRLPLR